MRRWKGPDGRRGESSRLKAARSGAGHRATGPQSAGPARHPPPLPLSGAVLSRAGPSQAAHPKPEASWRSGESGQEERPAAVS